jgi:hypothetical protein
MTWHAPLISPAIGFYLLLAAAVIFGLGCLVGRILHEVGKSYPAADPHAEPYGDQ